MSGCTTYELEKNGNNLELSLRIKKLKPPKELRVQAETLPADSDATVELIEFDNYCVLLFGISIAEDGVDGKDGLTGSAGSQGIKGDKGDAGERGLQGFQGIKGDTGATGNKGRQRRYGTTRTAREYS
jgi:hypothetical protein